jgi:proteic killer suppression protein
MEISFKNDRLRKDCLDGKRATQLWGADAAARLRRRLDDLRALDTLEHAGKPPFRCHELKHDLAGKLAIDVHRGLRLVFVPANEPVPRKTDGGLDWTKVTAICVEMIGDYHD